MNKTTNWIVGIIIIAVVIWFGFLNKPTEPVSTEPIKIGVILPLTGDAASYGQTAQRGVELAVEKIKNEDGIDVEVIFEDSQIDPAKAVSSLQKLINLDNIDYVLGFSSGETLAMCPISNLNEVILMTIGTSPEITGCGDYTFRDSPSDIYQGIVLAEKVSDNNYENIALIYINNDYGVGLKTEFEKNFEGNILLTESFGLGETDFRTQLTKIKTAEPEAIVLIGIFPEVGRLLKQRAELDILAPIFGSEGVKNDSLFEEVPADMLDDIYAIFTAQYEGSEYQEFKNAHLQRYGEEYGAFSDYVYDNILTLVDAIKRCKDFNDVECVKENIYKTDIVGATGRIEFDENGDVINKLYSLYKVENNEFIEVE
ncbi:MAG: ABC transporter substrate-binding protein [Candidatus Pacebacteria bacterium]|nr:ABC transporter substrate-binding protein [Candidatus Paceibacterota bacterium]